ncbi:unnamed protein product [Orchesella dallaii]|uniref:Nibrin second BRCT domain-containing protein n=1 Tax=Orchesella dallaii TaxID=48710 RepID=A0ABP1QRD3_9HEXA
MLKIVATHLSQAHLSFSLVAEKKYIIGRKQGDIIFPNDPSISQCHAELIVKHAPGNLTEPLLVPVLDIKSVDNGAKIYAGEENIQRKVAVSHLETVSLGVGYKFALGSPKNEFRIDYTPFIAVSSGIGNTLGQGDRDKISKLGGHYIDSWNESATHLLMTEINLTVKVVCALLSAKPIVTPAYISDLLLCLMEACDQSKRLELPHTNLYLPLVNVHDMETNSKISPSTFFPDPERRKLFAGKTFLFSTKRHLRSLESAIIAGAGVAKLIEEATQANIVDGNHIIVGGDLDIDKAKKNRTAKIIVEIYVSNNKRFVDDEELGMAALYKSIAKFCNPDAARVVKARP